MCGIQKVGVYIDGFNLFFGALKQRSEYRWLDLKKLVENVCKPYFLETKYEIKCIKFFTARVSARTSNDDSPKKQQIYFNALKSIQNTQIILGNFLVNKKLAVIYPLEYDENNIPKKQTILHTEEKGSDVNLATHFLVDSFRNEVDVAIMITNDTDLVMPIKIVSEELNKKVIVISPFKNTAYSIKKLKKIIKYTIDTSHLKKSQFPDIITDSNGNIIAQRPDKWK